MARATSIISQSGAGVSLEARVAGVFLAAMLAEASGPGMEPANIVDQIDFQRTDPAAGFDDLHVRSRTPMGAEANVYLQIKRTLTGERSEVPFKRPVADATLHIQDATNAVVDFRIVASESAIAPRDTDRARSAANLSTDSTDFWQRWATPGQSSDAERQYTSAIEWGVEQTLDRADPDLAWQVISRFGITVLDVDQTESQAIALAVDRLRGVLRSGDRGTALTLYEALCQFAEDAAKVAGGVDRAKLIAELAPRFPLVAGPAARTCVDRMSADGNAALTGIRDDIAGVRVPRTELTTRLSEAMENARALRLGGDAGSGKSAALRSLAEHRAREGDGLLVLRFDRLVERSWSAHATSLQVTTPLPQLLCEIAASGAALLVLDGLDRMLDAGFGELVREICQAIEQSPCALLWRCVASSREAVGLEPWLQYPLLRDLRTVSVGAPAREDLTILAEAFPHLEPLIGRRGFNELNRNLFFIDQMARNPSLAGASSELDLIQAWAVRGATEAPPHPSRDATLRALGVARIERPYVPLPKPADEDGLARLASERTVVIPAYRDVVQFGHDIYEDWAVARALDARRSEIPAILFAAGQPLAWMRAIRLVAEIAVETDGASGWLAFYDLLGADGLDATWRRMALTAALYSPRSAHLLDELDPTLLADNGRLMGDLLDTLQTIDIRPHPVILQSSDYDHLDGIERRRLALQVAIPVTAPWHAFLTWSVGHWQNWPKILIYRLASATLIWLRVAATAQITGAMVQHCLQWLRDLDAINARGFDDWEECSRLLREMGAERSGSEDRVGDMLALVIAKGVGTAQTEIDEYLASLVGQRSNRASQFVETHGDIPSVLPSRFADLVIATQIMRHDPNEPLDFAVEQSCGIYDGGRFFPASPTRAGFDQLFAADEDQALRLLNALSGAAAAVWRRRQTRRGLTPRPLRFDWQGDTIELWGDEHVYKWGGGLLRPNLLCSGFLAASGWVMDQLEEGRDVDELIEKILRSSQLVASATVCVMAAKTAPRSLDTLRRVMPLLVLPRLWGYDLRLKLDERSPATFNQGWRRGDEAAYRAARTIWTHRVAQLPMVESLIAPIHLLGDDVMREAFDEAVAAWTVDDLASADEQLSDPDARAELEEELENWRAKADPSNWNVTQGPNENSFGIGYTPPAAMSERVAEAQGRSEDLAASAPLMEWAFGNAKRGVTPTGQTALDVLSIAKELDAPDLFDHPLDPDPAMSVRSKGVAAVAAGLALRGAVEEVEHELPWIDSILSRAAAIDYSGDELYYEETHLDDDATASAARGLGALVMRGLATPDHQRIWLGLVASSFRDIAAAALEPACSMSTMNPVAASAAFWVSAASMIYQWRPYAEGYKELYAERCLDAVDTAMERLITGEIVAPDFPPAITEPFQGGDGTNLCAGSATMQFDHFRATKVWKQTDFVALSAAEALSEPVQRYFADAVLWLNSYGVHQQDRFGVRARLMDWEYTLGRIVGSLSLSVHPERANALYIAPVVSIVEAETRTLILTEMLEAFARSLVDDNRPLDAAFEAIWRPAAQAVFTAARVQATRRWDPESGPVAAAAFAMFGNPVFPPDWPRAGELVGLLDEWVAECARYKFSASIVRTLVNHTGNAFVPSPGMAWLEAILAAHRNTSDEEWRSQIGSPAGDLLAIFWTRCSADQRRTDVVRFRMAAAQLADRGVPIAAELLPEIAMVQSGV